MPARCSFRIQWEILLTFAFLGKICLLLYSTQSLNQHCPSYWLCQANTPSEFIDDHTPRLPNSNFLFQMFWPPSCFQSVFSHNEVTRWIKSYADHGFLVRQAKQSPLSDYTVLSLIASSLPSRQQNIFRTVQKTAAQLFY